MSKRDWEMAAGDAAVMPDDLPDIAPAFLGNETLKEFILYSMLVFDENDVRGTLAPVVIIAESGGGKTELLFSLEGGLGPDVSIWGVDSITAPSLKGMMKKGKVSRGLLTRVSCFDEINKWAVNLCEGVLLPVFGGEHGKRMREGEVYDTSSFKTVPVGTLLPKWRDFEGDGKSAARRTHTLEQLLRRCVIMRLESSLENEQMSDEYLQMCMSQVFSNVVYERKVDFAGHRERFDRVLRYAAKTDDVAFDLDDLKKTKKMMNEARKHIVLSENVRYSEEFPKLCLKLAKGRALAHLRDWADYKDMEYIVNMLTAHAKRVGMWEGDKCKITGDQQTECVCDDCMARREKEMAERVKKATDGKVYDHEQKKWVKVKEEKPEEKKEGK